MSRCRNYKYMLFLIYEVLHEGINIDLSTKMIQHNNALRTHLVLNHKAKGLSQRPFSFWSAKG